MSIMETNSTSPAGPFCRNCIHLNANGKGMPPMCNAPRVTKTICLVDGIQLGPTCSKQRSEGGECKAAGLLFERKEETPAHEVHSHTGCERDTHSAAEIELKRARLQQIRLKLQEPGVKDAVGLPGLIRELLEAESSQLVLEIARVECAQVSSK